MELVLFGDLAASIEASDAHEHMSAQELGRVAVEVVVRQFSTWSSTYIGPSPPGL